VPRGERFTRVPHYVLEALIRARLSSTALQLCLWIARETWGWNKRWTQPMSGRGLARKLDVTCKPCQLALEVLRRHGLVEVDAQQRYRLNPDEAIWKAFTLAAAETESPAPSDSLRRHEEIHGDGVGRQQSDGVGRQSEKQGDGVGRQGDGVGRQGDGVGRHSQNARGIQSLTVETVSDSRDSTSGTGKDPGAGPGEIGPEAESTSGNGISKETPAEKPDDPVVHWYPVKGVKGDRPPAAGPGIPPPPGLYWPLRKSRVEQYREAFPAVDVDQELRNLLMWCRDNQSRRKTYGGMPAFLTRNLTRKQDRPGWRRSAAAPIPPAAEAQKAESMRRAADRLANFE